MESLNFAGAVKKIYESNRYFFNLKTLRDIIEINKRETFFKYVQRMVKEEILIKLERNKYLLKKAKISDFELANFIYEPSYISFESALNFWGILSQFPYEITSATVKKTVNKKVADKFFSYSHIDKKLFFGFKKVENFLIAYPEKALLDQLYFVCKGLKKINPEELNYQGIDKRILKDFIVFYPKNRQFKKMLEILKNYIRGL